MNILIDAECQACLSDFGLASIINDGRTTGLATTDTNGTYGTTRWMAPELLLPRFAGREDPRSTIHTDIYAFGMVVWEVCDIGTGPWLSETDVLFPIHSLKAFTGCIPYCHHRMDPAVITDIVNGVRPTCQGHSSTLRPPTHDVRMLYERCWHMDYRLRPAMDHIIAALESAHAARKYYEAVFAMARRARIQVGPIRARL